MSEPVDASVPESPSDADRRGDDRPRRFHVLVNGGAGSVGAGAEADQQRAAIAAAFEAAGAEATVEAVDPEDLPDAVASIWSAPDRPEAVVVAGGDGTVNCAAGAAVGTDIVLGVLPLGTFDHFAKDLGMPTDLAGAAAAIVGGHERAVDVGEVNGRVFVNNSALGVYPEMVAVRDAIRERRGWGKVRAVPVAAARVLRAFPTHRLDLRGDDGYRRARVRTPFVFVGNGTYDDGGAALGGRGSLDDGRLGVYVARVVSRWGLVRTVLRAVVSGTEAARDLDRVELRELEVGGRSRRIRVALDGEVVWLDAPLRYRTRPGALRVVAPAPAAEEPTDPPVPDVDATR